MKKRKRLLIVAVILVLSMLFTACGEKEADGTDAGKNITTEESKTAEDSKTTDEESDINKTEPVLKEKLTLKILMYQGSNPDAVPSSDDPVYQELERLTNVHLDIEVLPYDNAEERFTAAMAAKERFDIVAIKNEGEPFDMYGMEGSFIPLQDLIEQHAPNIKKAFDDPRSGEILPFTQNVWSEMTASDGNIYSVPILDSTNTVGSVFAVREDWLKTLNLKAPETIDELYNVLKAFRKNDPNGNNQEDEIPFGFQGGPFLRVMPFINAFGAHISLYVDETDDTIKYGPVEQSWKEGMAFLNKLYKEELIDNEFRPGESKERWASMVSANRLGMMYVWPMSGICKANNELVKIDESYAFVPMLPLKGADGKRFKDTSTAGSLVVPGAAAITSFNNYPVETIKYLDFLYSEEGIKLATYGVDGVHYNIVDGKPVYSDLIMKNPDGLDPSSAAAIEGAGLVLPTIIRWDCSIQLMKEYPEVVDAWDLYKETGIVEAPLPKLHFKEDELEKGKAIMDEIQKYVGSGYVGDKISAFITGEESLDKYDDFVAQIKKMGLDEALRIYNEAYKRYKGYAK